MPGDSNFNVPVQCGHCKHSFICRVPAVGRYEVGCPECDQQVTFAFAGEFELR